MSSQEHRQYKRIRKSLAVWVSLFVVLALVTCTEEDTGQETDTELTSSDDAPNPMDHSTESHPDEHVDARSVYDEEEEEHDTTDGGLGTDGDDSEEVALSPTCDSDAPIGHRNGQRIISFTLPMCDGTPFELESQCGVPVTEMSFFAGWCSKCRESVAETVPGRIERYSAQGYAPILVILQNNEGAAPDAQYCEQIRQAYDIAYPVLYDAEGFISEHYQIAGGNDPHIILDSELIVHYRGQQYRYEETVDALIEDLLQAEDSEG